MPTSETTPRRSGVGRRNLPSQGAPAISELSLRKALVLQVLLWLGKKTRPHISFHQEKPEPASRAQHGASLREAERPESQDKMPPLSEKRSGLSQRRLKKGTFFNKWFRGLTRLFPLYPARMHLVHDRYTPNSTRTPPEGEGPAHLSQEAEGAQHGAAVDGFLPTKRKSTELQLKP